MGLADRWTVRLRPLTTPRIARRPAEPQWEPIEAGSLKEFLALLWPARFVDHPLRRLVIDCRIHAPFGPDPATLLAELFDDFAAAVGQLRQRLALDRVEVRGLDPPRYRWPEGVVARRLGRARRGDIALDAADFRCLYDAVTAGHVDRRRVVSVFLSPASIHCFLAREAMPLAELLESESALAEHQARHRGVFVYHPVGGHRIDVESANVGPLSDLLVFSDSGQVLRPPRGLLLAFPYFDRTLTMRRGAVRQIPERPCINCLACGRVCPVRLYPTRLHHNLLRNEVDEAVATGLLRCIECGLCTFVCPSGLKLHSRLAGGIAAARQLVEDPCTTPATGDSPCGTTCSCPS